MENKEDKIIKKFGFFDDNEAKKLIKEKLKYAIPYKFYFFNGKVVIEIDDKFLKPLKDGTIEWKARECVIAEHWFLDLKFNNKKFCIFDCPKFNFIFEKCIASTTFIKKYNEKEAEIIFKGKNSSKSLPITFPSNTGLLVITSQLAPLFSSEIKYGKGNGCKLCGAKMIKQK